MKKLSLFLLSITLTLYSQTQENPLQKGLDAITHKSVQAQLEFLSSDWMEGRETGKEGQYMAADYIASMFKVYDLLPAGDIKKTEISFKERMQGKKAENHQTYFQDLNLVEYVAGENQIFNILPENKSQITYNFKYKTDFTTEPANIPQELTSEVIFVGYGFVNDEAGYDDFKGLDVKGKIIMVLDGLPGANDPSSEAYKKLLPEDRMERMKLRFMKRLTFEKLGVAAVIFVNLEKDAANDFVDNVPFRYNEKYYEGTEKLTTYEYEYSLLSDKIEPGYTKIQISNRVLNELIKGTDLDFEKFEISVSKTAKPDSKLLKGKRVYLKTDVVSRIVQTRNVLAKIEGEDNNNIVVIGGHYDHEGMRKGFIFNGADDNASGTVGVMALAKAFAEAGTKPKHTIVFAAWSGEERGLLGSKYFADNMKENVILYLNYDMISRDNPGEVEGNEIEFTYTDTYPVLKDMTEKYNTENNYGLKITFDGSPKPMGGSDHTSFTMKSVPIIYYMAGFHDEYHTPVDSEDKVNYDKMIKIIKMGFLSIWDVANGNVSLAK